MTIAATSTASTAPQAGAASQLSGNLNNFLKLLMAQLQNQNPTSPMDTNQFTAQLVQFASVEQQTNTNASLTQLIQLTQGGDVLQSAALLGKTVQATSDHIPLQNGAGNANFTLQAAQPVRVTISSEAGTVLRAATVSGTAGANRWSWDGKDDAGRQLPDGSYRIAVTSAGGSGTPTDVPFTVSGTATGVQRSGNSLSLQLGALSVDLSAVQSVGSI